MKIQTIGVMGPGEMGHAVAQQLMQKEFNVFTALDKRSARSKAFAKQIGLTDIGSIQKLTERCDLILSIVSPGQAMAFAGEVAQLISSNRRDLLFADCNAISPMTVRKINEKITAAGARCIDACIIGPAPRGAAKTRLYLAGSAAHELEQLETAQIKVRVLSDRIGDASAMKMCHVSMSKSTAALVLELLVAARRLGVDAALKAHFEEARSPIYDAAMAALPDIPPKAERWVPELLEIAQTFESVGLTPRIPQGVADMYEFVAATELGKASRENPDKSYSGNDIAKLLGDEAWKIEKDSL